MSSPEKVKEEQAACRTAVAILNTTSMDVKRALSVLYDHASGYAGEVEASRRPSTTPSRCSAGSLSLDLSNAKNPPAREGQGVFCCAQEPVGGGTGGGMSYSRWRQLSVAFM
jgi:hypothetical protein